MGGHEGVRGREGGGEGVRGREGLEGGGGGGGGRGMVERGREKTRLSAISSVSCTFWVGRGGGRGRRRRAVS